MDRSHIIIHHSLTKDSGSVSWGAIRKYHIEVEKWRDIGYHYGVELVNDQYEALVGRPEDWVAAACYQSNMNEKGIHICCVGDYDTAPPPQAMLDVLTNRLVLPLVKRYKISPENIMGHRDFAHYKSCPGRQFDLDRLRKVIWNKLGVTR